MDLEYRRLVQEIKQKHAQLRDVEPVETAGKLLQPIAQLNLRPQRVLRGHCGAIYCSDYSEQRAAFATVGVDYNLILWNLLKASKISVQQTPQPYVLGAKFVGDGIVLGGLDCQASYMYSNQTQVLYQHEGFISSFSLLGGSLISTSADKTAMIYDLARYCVVYTYNQHQREVLCSDSLPQDNIFATGGADGFVRVFDLRVPTPVKIFSAQNADVYGVKFCPAGGCLAAVTSSQRGFLYDLRNEHLLIEYSGEGGAQEMRACEFSQSGRILFGIAGENLLAWDTFYGQFLGCVGTHDSYIGSICRVSGGNGIATCGWDALVKIWA